MLANMPLIAIVDDDAAVREALEDLLQVAGFGGKGYVGAADLLDDRTRERFAMIITDLRMPKIDGIELIRRLRAGGATMPILVLTSCTEGQVRQRALAAGAADCFTKPVDKNVLLQRIYTALDLSHVPDN